MAKKLAEADLSLTEHTQNLYTVKAPVGTTREEVLESVFWGHVARKLSPMSEIRIMPKDGAWYGVYLVLYADNLNVSIKELQHYILEDVDPADLDSDAFFIEWGSPAVKFRVIRKADNSVMKDQLKTKNDAIKWMADNLKSAAAAA